MAWWVLSEWRYWVDPTDLVISCKTNYIDHVYLTWDYQKPLKTPIYRVIRGVLKFCGWKYIWINPHITEQIETGETWWHAFGLHDLTPASTIWFLVWAPQGPYGLPIQGPLMHYDLTAMGIGARVARLTAQSIPDTTATRVIFQAQEWDDMDFFDPIAAPTRLTVLVPGRYHFGASLHFADAAYDFLSAFIVIRGAPIGSFVNLPGPIGPGYEPALEMSNIYEFIEADYLELWVYQDSGAAQDIIARLVDSPRFWIQAA